MRALAITVLTAISGMCGACNGGRVGEGVSVRSESEEKGWAGTSLEPDATQIAEGRRIAETECAVCHAIDLFSRSPNPAAPPLREVLAVNDPDSLAYRFIDALRIGHDEMPLFDFDIRAADALVAYLKSISEP